MAERLDKTDMRLLYELDWDARQSDSELAKKISKSREAVRYRMARLEERGIISGYVTWINVAKLGYQAYKLYLKIGGNEREREEFFSALKKHTDLFWLGIADGAWDVGLTFFARSNEEFFHRKSEIFARHNKIILQKFTGVAVDAYAYPMKLLHDEPKGPLSLFGSLGQNSLDDIDRRVLSELFHNSRIKLVELAAKTGVSVDIVRSRMKRMQDNGIIISYKAMVDYQKLGLEFYKAFLYFDSFSKEDEAKLFEIAKHDPNIIRSVMLISPWDIELEIMVESYQDFNRIIRRLKADFPNLRNVESATMSADYVFPAEGTIMKL
ncbi:MAG: Lrp/AsnC family transcriptional regulator [Candidatus Micrarchaeota archaeon]